LAFEILENQSETDLRLLRKLKLSKMESKRISKKKARKALIPALRKSVRKKMINQQRMIFYN
jgi:hypothetical protein